MTEDLPEAIESAPPDWRPRGEIDVERALRGLERLAARYAEVQHAAREWRADIDAWERQQTQRLAGAATALSLALEAWGLEQRALSRGKVMSWTFPSGSIETTKARAKVVVEDEDAAIEWCDANLPGAVKRTVSLLVSVIKRECDEHEDGRLFFATPDGAEFVPGVRMQQLPDSAASAVVKLSSQRALPKAVADE